MTILVTGGAGFIGSNFIRDWLADCDEPVVNLDKLTYAGNPGNLAEFADDRRYELVTGDIGDADFVASVLVRRAPRAVLNFAAESHVDRSIRGPEDFVQTNVVGTFRLLQSVLAYWCALSIGEKTRFRFLHVSTDEVYGSLAPGAAPFAESHAYAPNSPYAASKAASDHMVRAWGHTYGLPILVTNCSNNYGPFQFPEKLIPLCVHNAIAGQSLPLYGDGLQVRDWIYVGDHCSAIRRVLEVGSVGETYNIGSGYECTNLDVVRSLSGLLDRLAPRADGIPFESQIAFVDDRPGHDRRYAIDSQKIRRELGWLPGETFASGLEKTVRWYLDHAEWVGQVTSGAYREWIRAHYDR